MSGEEFMSKTTEEQYWEKCIAIAAEENNIPLTAEQITALAQSAQSGHENYGMAFYEPPAGEYLERENKRLREEPVKEQNKVVCPLCRGRGRLISQGPYHSSNSECWKCRGEGKV